MSGVLYVQGLELDVSVADWEPVRLGAVTRSFAGQPRSTVRATKREHHFTGDIQGMAVAMAELYRALIEGDGHSWNFNNVYDLLTSSRGLVSTETGAVADCPGMFGGGVEFDSGEAATVWAVGFGLTSTLMYWVKEAGVWVHYLVRRVGALAPSAVWRNSVRTDSDPQWLVFGAGGLLVADPSLLGTYEIDDLVALPYAIPDAWVTSFISWRTANEWNPLPYVAASGAAFPAGPVKGLGLVGAAHRVPLWSNGTFGLGEVLDFTLTES